MSVGFERVNPAWFRPFTVTAAVVILFSVSKAFAENADQVCRRLAGPAVAIEQIDSEKAVPACATAVSSAPDSPPLALAYGRALERAGRFNDARSMYKWAADHGLPEGTEALAKLAAAETPARPEDPEQRKRWITRLGGVRATGARIAASTQRDYEDPVAVLAKTGTVPEAIVAWVRENTRLVPYVGMLRGPAGVLMDRVGNSLDRALLTADLLQRAGHAVRLNHATLPPEMVLKLRARFLAAAVAPKAPVTPDRAELLNLAGDDPRFDKQSLEKSAGRVVKYLQRFDSAVRALFSELSEPLTKLAGNLDQLQKELNAEIDNGLKEYYWVERRMAAGWEPLTIDQDVQPQRSAAGFSLDQLPVDVKHYVTLRLIVETLSSGKLGEKVLLERRLFPADLIGKSITLGHSLLPQPDIKETLKKADPQRAFVEALAEAWVVNPVLQIAGENVSDQLFTLDGRVLPANLQTLAGLGIGGLANVSVLNRAFKETFGEQESRQETEESKTQVTAEWVEFEIGAPGRATKRERRAIFDLLGPAARKAGAAAVPLTIDGRMKASRALALSGMVDVFIFGAAPAKEYLTRTVSEGLSAALEDSIRSLNKGDGPEDVLSRKAGQRLQLPLWGWALNRAATGLLPHAAPVAPNVVLLWQQPSLEKGKAGSIGVAIDVVQNSTILGDDARHRIAQGLLDTVVEHELVTDGGTGGNTAVLFAADSRNKKSWQLITAASALDPLSIPKDSKARIAQDLEAGYVAIVPFEPVNVAGGALETAWWRIDPKTGDTIGITKAGMGGDATEEPGLIYTIPAKALCAFVGFGTQVVGGHFSIVSTALVFACWKAPVHPSFFKIGVHGIIDLFLDVFLTAALPAPWEDTKPPEPPAQAPNYCGPGEGSSC